MKLQNISQNIQKLLKTVEVRGLLEKKEHEHGDLIDFASNFTRRDGLGSQQSELHLALEITRNRQISKLPKVVSLKGQRALVRLYKNTDEEFPSAMNLDEAIQRERNAFGVLPFILIADIDDTERYSVSMKGSVFQTLSVDPGIRNHVKVLKDEIIIRKISNERFVWEKVSNQLIKRGISAERINIEKDKLTDAFIQLRRLAKATVKLDSFSGKNPSLLSVKIDKLESILEEYGKSLRVCDGDPGIDSLAYSNVLRTAYFFVHEIFDYLRLLTHICDTKPILFWAVGYEYYELRRHMRALPWSQMILKQSFKSYLSIVRGSQRTSVGELSSIDRSLTVPLPNNVFGDPVLILYSDQEPGSGANSFDFNDQALVRKLLRIGRNDAKYTSPEFWIRNEKVMQSMLNILDSSDRALRAMRP